MTREELEKKYLGKRVAVYMSGGRRVGIVKRVVDVYDIQYCLVVNLFSQVDGALQKDNDLEGYVHYKQVRLLKKKERRRIWVKDIYKDGLINSFSHLPRWVVYDSAPFPNDPDFVEFIEVKK